MGNGVDAMKPISRRSFMVGASATAVAGMRTHIIIPKEVTFGLTPVFLDSDIQLLSDLERYLKEALHQDIRLVKRRTYQEIMSLLLPGLLDVAWICGYPYVRHKKSLSLVATPLYQGKPLYRAYLIVKRDSPANTLEDLRGHTHAFSDSDSNSGFLVTRHLLAEKNEAPDTYFRKTIFTLGHRNVIRAVASGLTDSGSVDGYVWDVMQETEPELVAATRVIRQSEPMGFPPIACAALMKDTAVTREITAALMRMHEDDLGQRILATLRLDGFQPSDPHLYDGIAERYEDIKGLV